MKKSRRQILGQHFLKDPNALRKIVRLINPLPQDTLIEIGPGKGALTFRLTPKAGKIIAIEKDPLLASGLLARAGENLRILETDVLRVSFKDLIPRGKEVKLVGNLPYSIGSVILFKALEERSLFKECHFLLQKEVAERLCATAGSKAQAPLSLYFSNFFSRKLQFTLPPAAFSPPPKVDSAFVSLFKRQEPLFVLPQDKDFLAFLKTAFRHRRKTLYNNLLLGSFSPENTAAAFRASGLGPSLRAEQVSLEQFVSLFNHL
jgi:16S rRNA (adenine1518-N6/adenine1519-N6)-dimethyltransferase